MRKGTSLAHRVQSRLCFVFLALATLAAPADAIQWGFSVGAIDVFRDFEAVEAGVELQWAPRRWGLVPHAGVHGTADESFYAFVGLRRPFAFAKRWYVEPSFAFSLYERGEGKELGGPIEFRSGIELGRTLEKGPRLGLGFFHLSNSSIYDLNPGTNSLLLRVVLPDGEP